MSPRKFMAAREPPWWQVAHWVTAICFVSWWRTGRPAFSLGMATSFERDLPSSA
jgi:hypothetical protein